MIQARNTNKVI